MPSTCSASCFQRRRGGPLLLTAVCTAGRRTERVTPLSSAAAAESEEGAPSRLSARRLEGSHRLSRPTAASPPGVRRRWRLQPLSLRRMSPEAGERRTAAAGVRHRRWKTGDDGGRSCYVLAGCSSLPPATCFVDVVAVRRRRRITAKTDALGVPLSAAHKHRLP